MTARAFALAILCSAGSGCALHHGRGDDAGIPGASDAIAPTCPPIACADGCYDVVGPDGCNTCRCGPLACASDADCVVAFDLCDCCGCPWAHTVWDVESAECLVQNGDGRPSAGGACRDRFCDCSWPPRAVCVAGACEPAYTCRPDQVLFRNECAPRCATHADCVVATDQEACCGGTCDAFPRALALDRACWAAAGESGVSCPLDPARCDGLGCARTPCPDDAHAACMDDGTCVLVETPIACPPGSHESGGRCVR
jgi:hypothetical protein